MVDNTVDYTPNAFNRLNSQDTRFNIQNPQSNYYNGNFVLQSTPEMNDADAEAILGRDIYEPVYSKSSLNSDMDHLLIDPALQKAIQTDPTVKNAILNNPTMFPPQNKYLIEMGDDSNKSKDAAMKISSISNKIRNEIGDEFWLNDPLVLFRNGNYYKIIPNNNMTKIEVLNALTRFFLYLSILYVLFTRKWEYLYIPFVAIMVIILLYFIQKNDMKSQLSKMKSVGSTFEGFPEMTDSDDLDADNIINNTDNANDACQPTACDKIDMCQRPTKGNPFMNVTMADLMINRNRSAACLATDELINKEINDNFHYNFFKDVDDVFNRQYSQRQFYTMPNTTIPNNQTAFAKWLYKLPPTCKEDQNNCLIYEDLRFNRFNPNTDRMVRIKEDLI